MAAVSTIAEFLGGRKALGVNPTSAGDWDALIRARIAGGRWNRPGEAVVYASASLALAAIETFIHLGDDALHIEFVHFRIEIPGSVAIQRGRRPPPGWRADPPADSSMRYGSTWLRQARTAVL